MNLRLSLRCLIAADNKAQNASGREEFNSVQEAFDAIAAENEWELSDGR